MEFIHYFSPCSGSSKGHTAIQHAVQTAVTDALPTHLFKPTLSFADNSMQSEDGVLIVDFPDISSWPQLTHFIRQRPKWRTIYLSMIANLGYIRSVEPDPEHIPSYDIVVALEPGAGRLQPSNRPEHNGMRMTRADHAIAPLLQPFMLTSSKESVPPGSMLVIPSGYPEERRGMEIISRNLARRWSISHVIFLDDLAIEDGLVNRQSLLRPISLVADERFSEIGRAHV